MRRPAKNGIDRRTFVQWTAAGIATAPFGLAFPQASPVTLPAWRRGELDIHFIHTGVGEQTFFIFPDGTTMLLDCGDTHHAKYMCDVPPRPDATRYGGEWVSRYIQRVIPEGRTIDYVMVSHWHGDHCGDLDFGGKKTADGRTVCGIPLVGEDFHFRHYIDHQYPKMAEHAFDPDPKALSLMRAWIPFAQKRDGMTAEKLVVGACDQIRLQRDRAAFPTFEIRNLAGNGVLWNGRGGVTDHAALTAAKIRRDAIHENRLSCALRLSYGNFRYYTGGDNELTLCGADGQMFNWEEAIGRVCGPVDVAKTNHHAGTMGMSAGFCRAVRAQVYLSSVWQAKMVDRVSLDSMCSRTLYPGDRRVCYGHIAEKVKAVAAAYGRDIAPAGHTVVRVAPGGATFRVFSLDASDESMRVLAVETRTSRGGLTDVPGGAA